MKLKIFVITPILILMGLNAESMKGTTVGHYAKPGAPIDMSYVSKSHGNDEENRVYDVNITLSTTVHYGTMSAKINVDDKLTPLSTVEKEMHFELNPEKKKYHIDMQVSAKEDGLYYIRLLTKIDKGVGSKLRAFAVPVQVGEKKRLDVNTMIMKSHSGENISISKAVETIIQVETK